jgi:hypothetical protein
MAGVIERLLSLSPDELNRIPKRRRNSRRRRRERPERTKEQLADYLREKGFKTRDQLRNGRDEGDPTDTDYRREWGSWTAAVKEVWGKPIDRAFVAKGLIQFELWTARAYQAKRKERPYSEILPSLRAINKEFGSWSALKRIARAMSLGKVLDDYIALKKKLGRRPKLEDCKAAGIVLEKALEIHRTKRAFDMFIDDLEKIS